MKTYKHRVTGIVGKLEEDGHLHFERGNEQCVSRETIWKGFIENSLDWEEAGEPLFTTWNGESIYSGQPYWLVIKENWTIEEDLKGVECVDFAEETEQDEIITFISKLAAEKYIEETKPQFNLLELIASVNNWAYIKGIKEDHILKFIEKWREK